MEKFNLAIKVKTNIEESKILQKCLFEQGYIWRGKSDYYININHLTSYEHYFIILRDGILSYYTGLDIDSTKGRIITHTKYLRKYKLSKILK